MSFQGITFALVWLVMALGPMSCRSQIVPAEQENKHVQSPVVMQAEILAADDGVKISYVVHNHSETPILVLDRLWNRKMKSFDPNWAFVEIRGSKALIKRVMEPKPQGLIVERPPVPYGREVAPGEKAEGSFTLPVPLRADGSYDAYVMPNAVEQEVEVTDIGFMLAWTTKPKEILSPAMRLVKNGEETLQPFQYHVLDGAQRFLTSSPATVRIKGIAKIPQPR